MKTQEFKVGNIIILNGLRGESNIIVQEIRKTGIIHNDNPYITPFELLKPIPLTEEWLKKFGFKKGFNGMKQKEYGNNGIFIYKYSEYDFYSYVNAKIYFVHHLQNLYHALTENELVLAVGCSPNEVQK